MAHKINCGSCKGTHATVAGVQDCYAQAADFEAQAAAEVYAEAFASWVSSGGSVHDAPRYASVIAAGGVWNGGIGEPPADEGTCHHGLSAALCQDPDGDGHWGTAEQEMADPASW